MKSPVRCVVVVSPIVDLCELYEDALTSAGFAVITSATLPTGPTDAEVIIVQLHPHADARDISRRLRLCAPQAVLIALTSVVRGAGTAGFETELLLPVLPDSLLKTISALNRTCA